MGYARSRLRSQAHRNAGSRFGGDVGKHAEKRCGEEYAKPEMSEMIDDVMKEDR
jgi:hypothetical protein